MMICYVTLRLIYTKTCNTISPQVKKILDPTNVALQKDAKNKMDGEFNIFTVNRRQIYNDIRNQNEVAGISVERRPGIFDIPKTY